MPVRKAPDRRLAILIGHRIADPGDGERDHRAGDETCRGARHHHRTKVPGQRRGGEADAVEQQREGRDAHLAVAVERPGDELPAP